MTNVVLQGVSGSGSRGSRLRKKAFCLFALFPAVVQFAGEVQWTPGATSLDEGRILVEYDGTKVSRMTVAADEPVTLISDSAIDFAADSSILIANGGDFRMNAGIAGDGALSFGLTHPRVVYANQTDFLPAGESEAVVLMSGVDLSDYEISGTAFNLKSGSSPYNWIPKTTLSTVHFIERGEGGVSGDSGTYSYHLSCQVQGVDDYARCVMLEIRQRGNDIIAWTPSCYHAVRNLYGADFRKLPDVEDGTGRWEHDIASTAKQTYGYGLANLELTALAGASGLIALSKSVVLGGGFSVARDLVVEAKGSTALTDTQEWGMPLAIDGTFRIRNHAFLRLTGNVNYGAEGRLELVADASHENPMPDHLDLGDYPGKSWAKVASGVHVLSVSNITAKGAGSWLSFSDQMPLYFFCNTGTNLTCQFQIASGNYVKGMVYELLQVGDDIEARMPYVGYKDYGSADMARANVGLYDIQVNDPAPSKVKAVLGDWRTGPDVNGYGLMEVKLWLDGSFWRGVELAGKIVQNGWLHAYGSASEGIFVRAMSPEAEPSVTVHDGGVFCIQNKSSKAREFVMESGGEIVQNGLWTISQDSKLFLRGGTFVVGNDLIGKKPTSEQGGLYLNRVTFEDGGRISGLIPKSGYYSEPVWNVLGTHPAILESGIALTSADGATKDQVCQFNVEDVTGDDAADLVIGGCICYGSWNKIGIRKTGVGTVLATARNEASLHPLRVEGGLWKLGATSCMTPAHVVELSGGSLGSAAGVSNAIGQVSLANNTICGIELEAGSELDLSHLALGANSRLNVVTDESATARLRVLTPCSEAELRQIRVNGKRAAQDSDGCLKAGNFGLVLVVQ